MKQKTYYDFVNVAKLILALSIVGLHSALVPDHSWPMAFICRLGVPYFFVASGFFLQRKCAGDQTAHAVKGYLSRLCLPYAAFSVIWVFQFLIDDVIAKTGYLETAVRLIQHLFFCPGGGLWYVWASIVGVIMLYPFIKRKTLLFALPPGIVLFMVGLLANNYYFLANSSAWLKPIVDGYLRICLVSNNALFVGFVFLLIGMLMSEFYDQIKEKIGIGSGLLLLVISCVLLALEFRYIESKAIREGDGAFYLSQLLYVPTVFFLTTRIQCPHLSRDFIIKAKNLSTGIYFLHLPILWIIHRAVTHVLPYIPRLNRFAPLFDHASVCFTCCLAACMIICLLAYRHPKTVLCKILK